MGGEKVSVNSNHNTSYHLCNKMNKFVEIRAVSNYEQGRLQGQDLDMKVTLFFYSQSYIT